MRALALLPLLLLAACAPKESPPPNAVLVVIDTLRADRLPFYGEERVAAPFLSAWAAKSVVFERAWSSSSWTAPSTASIFTSVYPNQHGVLTGLRLHKKLTPGDDPTVDLNRIPAELATIPSVLQARGYATYGIADNPNIGPLEGFDRGFDRFRGMHYQGAEALNAVLAEWAEEVRAREPHFVYLHYMDPHVPYHRRSPWYQGEDPEQRLNPGKEAGESAARYRSEISYLDQHLEEAFDLFEVDEETLVILTADHGEEFGDHGGKQHGFRLYSELTRVPLIVFDPTRNAARRRIPEDVSTLDLLPTLREILDLPASDQDQGRSLVPAYAGTAPLPPRTLFTMRSEPEEQGGRELVGVIARGHKLILTEPKGRRELYDLGADPGETTNLARENPELADALEAEWRRFAASARRWDQESEAVTLSPEAARRLAEIGYVDGED